MRLHWSMKINCILTVSVLLAGSVLASAATNDLPTLLQRGLFEEEANHQLDAAIGNYKEAIEHFDHERLLAATAIFRLGECYRKLGRTNEAAVQYQRIVREFDDQKDLVTLSRQNLAGMGISAAPALLLLSDAARHKQQKLLEEEIKVVDQEAQLQQTQFKTGLVPYEATLATQQKLLELKRQLAALEGDQAVSPSSIAASPTDASALPPDEDKFLREVKESVQNSPDLVNSQLITAAQNGYVSAAEFLLEHGADVNLQSPIVAAALEGNDAMVQMLLSHGALVNKPDEHNRPALAMAVDLGFMAVCRTLLTHGADVNLGSPLRSAITQGNEAMVQLLLSSGAAVNSPDAGGATPLSVAVAKVNLPLCQALLAHGADVNAKDNQGSTPLHAAVETGNLSVLEFLITNKAQIDAKNEAGLRPLHVAVDHGNLAVAEFLITNKAQMDLKTVRGKTPLLIAISRDDTNMVKLLLDSHADANMETSVGTSWRLSPLAWAIFTDRPAMVKLLLEGHADPNTVITSPPASGVSSSQADQAYVPVGQASLPVGFRAHLQAEQAKDRADSERWDTHNGLYPPRPGPRPGFGGGLGRGMDTWEMNWPQPVAGVTPLLWATWGHPPHVAEMVKLLLDHGANSNAADPNGMTALMNAIAGGQGNLDLVQTLIAHGADVNALDKNSQPPLAQLAFPLTDIGRQIQDLLIKAGADAEYNRRRGIWVSDAGGKPKNELFKSPTNSINHHTLLETLATLYVVYPERGFGNSEPQSVYYAHADDLVEFPDFARVAIHRLDGKRSEVLRVNVADIFQSGDCSKDVVLQAGDVVEIPKVEHKVADKWFGLSEADVTGFDKCLLRTVRVMTQGHTNEIALLPPFADAAKSQGMNMQTPHTLLDMITSTWLAESLKSRKADALVRSFLLNNVVRDDKVLLNTWDLSRVHLTRGGASMTFDLTANPPPDVWLEEGDVIQIPELGDSAAAAEAKVTPDTSGLH
jgi:ankyrin repeat protein